MNTEQFTLLMHALQKIHRELVNVKTLTNQLVLTNKPLLKCKFDDKIECKTQSGCFTCKEYQYFKNDD